MSGSNVGFIVDTSDLSNLFKPYTSGTKAVTTGFKNGANDLCDLYQKYVFSPMVGITNIKINDNTIDINTLFQKKMSFKSTNSVVFSGARINAITYNNNMLYVGGNITKINIGSDIVTPNIVMYNGISWTNMSIGLGTSATEVNDIVVVDSSNVYACGSFSKGVYKWDGNNWNTLGTGLYNTGTAIEKDNVDNIYVGGIFTRMLGDPTGTYNRIAKWNSTNNLWERVPYGSLVNQNGFNSTCFSIKYNKINGYTYFGGSFTGFYNSSNILTNASYIATYDGANLLKMGNGTNGTVNVIAINENDGTVYIGGSFTIVNTNTPAQYVAMWTPSSNAWEPVGSGLNGPVNALKFFNNRLYAGGSFTKLGDNVTITKYIAVYDNTNWNIIDNSLNNTVNTIEITNNAIYFGGTFTSPNSYYTEYS
jgi:hypothetical protein